jgi:hypothetical protein
MHALQFLKQLYQCLPDKINECHTIFLCYNGRRFSDRYILPVLKIPVAGRFYYYRKKYHKEVIQLFMK